MRLETLEIKNYRQYRNVKFDFSHPLSKHDIHIILGKNGTGKTNMLNAITWCLYGEEMHLGDKNISINKLNTEAIAEARETEKDRLKLEVSITLSTDDELHPKMAISRVVTYNIGPNFIQEQGESLEVQELDENNNWLSHPVDEDKYSAISRNIPQQINEYIFFDGEQLEKYFQGANRKKLQDGINSLTQVNLLEQAIEALNRYDKTELSPKIKSIGGDAVKKIQEQIATAEESLRGHKSDLEEVKKQKDLIVQRIEELKLIISNNDKLGEKKDKYFALQKALEDLNNEKVRKFRDLMTFVREQYILFGLYSPLIKYYKYIKEESDKGNLPPHFDKQLLIDILSTHTCAVCGQNVEGSHLNKVQALIDKINVSSNTAAHLNQALGILRIRLDEMKEYPKNLKRLRDSIKQTDNDLQACENEIASLKKYLDNIPGQEEILKAINEKETAENSLSQCDQKIGWLLGLKNQVQADLDRLNQAYQETLRKMENMKELSMQREYLEECKRILQQVKIDTIEETRRELEKETFKIFQSLIWKKDIFSRVEIDEDYNFRLFDKYGNQTLGSCSAAERALLALSFTLALQDISGHSSLLYIDTPIGRVDSENRENFMNNLLEVSKKKQVILTFTPTEYDLTVSEILHNNTSSFSKLVNDKGITSIEQK